MTTVNEIALKFTNSELLKAQIKVLSDESGREAVNFIIEPKNGKQY